MQDVSSIVRSKIHRPPLEAVHSCETHGDFTAKCHIGTVWTKCPNCESAERRAEIERQDKLLAEQRAEQWMRRLGHAGIPQRFQDRTLESFNPENEGQKAALAFATEYAHNFAEVRKSGRGAIFIGKPGTGKTHLACGIGLHVMREHRGYVLFMTVQRAIRSIKDTWAKGAERSESEAIAELVEPELLILDEVGVQFGTEFERNTLFDVLNERYERRRPTLFLSNLTKQEVAEFLGERVMDRLREDGGRVIPFAWDSYRSKAGCNQFS